MDEPFTKHSHRPLGEYALASILTFFNVWLTARLMFTDEHDLLLGTILLLFAGAIAMALGYLLSSSFLDRISSLDQAAKKNREWKFIYSGSC